MIEILNLKKQYELSTPLKNVNATINNGDTIALIGPSGTGKSTLLRCINLLEKPTSGHILIDGEDITNPTCDINRIRTKLGMVFQSFNLYEHLTVVENCMIAQTVLLKRTRQEAYDKAMKLLKEVGMETRALQYPSQLSGGQKQRVAIARTLSLDPEIILFDEPTSALDPLTVGEVEDVIDNLSRQGRTMMIVTHSMDFARKVSNRVFYMDQGEIYEEGTPKEIFENPKKELTKKFIRRLKSLEIMVHDETHDLTQELGKIISFCKSFNIETNRITNACNAYEEFFNILYLYIFAEEKSVRFTLEYDESNNKIALSFIPYSRKEQNDYEKIISDSIEYKLLLHYVNDHCEEQVEDGIGIKYTYHV